MTSPAPAALDRLAKHLGSLSAQQLDQLVARMTDDGYERAWLDADHLVGNASLYPPDLDVTVAALEAAIGEHELCSFIADDLTLLHRAEVAGLGDEPFIAALAAAYAAGRCGV